MWRYRWLVLLIAILSTAAAYFYATSTAIEEWSAEASVIAEDPLSSIIFESNPVRRADYLADQVELMRSGTVSDLAAILADAQAATMPEPFDFPYTGPELLEKTRIFEQGARISVRVTADSHDAAVIGANSLIEAYQDIVQSDAEVFFTNSVEVLDSVINELEDELVDIGQEIVNAQAFADPALEELDQKYADLLPRLVTIYETLETASGETRDELVAEVAAISQQLLVVEQVKRIEGSSIELTPLLERQRRTIGRIDELTEQRDQYRVDGQLVGVGAGTTTQATFATLIATDVLRLVAAGAFLGLLIGSGLAYMLALRRRSITDRAQPELVLAAPLIAEVPNFRQEGIRTALPVRSHPRSAAAESFRFAAAALDLSRAAPMGSIITEGKLVIVTSASVADGKTVVAANTALAAAKEGKRVLLIDADFGSQEATNMLTETKPKNGITEVVESGVPLADAVVAVEDSGNSSRNSGLHLLSRGWQTSSAPEFFRNPATRDFLDQIQEYYDLILLDTPPLLSVAYASTIAGMVDKVLVVTRHNTSATALEELQDRLDLVGTPTVGYVYNLAPLRLDISRNEGSMRDVLGESPAVTAGDA